MHGSLGKGERAETECICGNTREIVRFSLLANANEVHFLFEMLYLLERDDMDWCNFYIFNFFIIFLCKMLYF